MIRVRSMIPLLSVAVLFIVMAPARAQSPSDLFQRALRVERVEGDLEEAIRLYRQVVELDDRALAARALLRIGESYERLGREGAEQAYRRLTSEFADQTDEADAARSRLAALTRVTRNASAVETDRAGADRLSLRLLWPDGPWAAGGPTPDGKELIYSDVVPGKEFSLAARVFTTGEDRILKAEGGGTYPIGSAVSNGGDRVAFQWIPGPWQPQLRVIGIDGTGERILIDNGTVEIDYITPLEWTPDDREILVEVTWMDGHRSIGLVSVADGTMRTLRSFTLRDGSARQFSLSPDGRWVAYQSGTEESAADISLLATDGSASRKLITHPAFDLHPIWAPDGRHLLFISDRGGSVDLWAVRIADGNVDGEAFVVQREIGMQSHPLGFTDDGSLFLNRPAGGGDIFAVELDEGRVAGEPERVVQVYQGYNNAPAWSMDGSRMAYVSRRSPGFSGNGANLIVRDEATGREVEPAPDVFPHRGRSHPSVSPDGTRIVVPAWSDEAGGWRLHLIDLTDGSVRTLEEPGPPSLCGLCPVVSSNDGTAVFYSSVIPAPPLESSESCPLSEPRCVEYRGLIRHDLATGRHDRVFAWDLVPSARGGSWGLSPDQTRVVTLQPDPAGDATIVRIGALGTDTREEIARFHHDRIGCTPDHEWSLPVWTDSDQILFVCRRPREPGETRMGEMRPSELMSLPVAGGEPRSTGLVMEELRQISIRPDGRLGFAAGPKIKQEIWVLSGLTAKLDRAEYR